MPTIMDFQSQMKGFMRPNKFTITISKIKAGSLERFDMSCFQCQLPGNVIATTDKDTGFRGVAYQTVYSDIILGFYCDDKMKELKFWQHWIEQIHTKPTNQWAYYDDYISDITITPINRSGDNVATWTLKDAYPKQIDPIQLDYGTNDAVMTINATITYRHFTVVWEPLVNGKQIEIGRQKGITVEPIHTIDQTTDLGQTNLNKSYENLKATHRNESDNVFMKRMLSDGTYDYANDPTTKEAMEKRAREGGLLHSVVKTQE